MSKSKKSKSGLLPARLLRELGRAVPGIWKQAGYFRSLKGTELPDWPDWCYLPLAAGCAISSGCSPLAANYTVNKTILSPGAITALATWRVSQGYYRYDPDLYRALITQPLDGDLPCEALLRLPEWCVYIETPGVSFADNQIDGFFAHLESDANDGRVELRLLLASTRYNCISIAIHLGKYGLLEGIGKMLAEAEKHASTLQPDINLIDHAQAITKYIVPFVQLVLYLCADNIDLPERPQHPLTRFTRAPGQAAPLLEPRIWKVGERLGSAFRKYANEQNREQSTAHGSHASPRPHIRRAHWHHFWTGPKTQKQKLVLRWLPPVPVNTTGEYTGPVVIHNVGDDAF